MWRVFNVGLPFWQANYCLFSVKKEAFIDFFKKLAFL